MENNDHPLTPNRPQSAGVTLTPIRPRHYTPDARETCRHPATPSGELPNDYHPCPPAGRTAGNPPGPYQVIVTYEDGADFDGDWRWSADCPAIGCASAGRTREEALLMIADAIQLPGAIVMKDDAVGGRS